MMNMVEFMLLLLYMRARRLCVIVPCASPPADQRPVWRTGAENRWWGRWSAPRGASLGGPYGAAKAHCCVAADEPRCSLTARCVSSKCLRAVGCRGLLPSPSLGRCTPTAVTGQTMVSKYGKDFTVPKDFPSVLKAFTREVLRSQPGNIYEFGAAYFSELMDQSQQEVGGGAQERLTPEEMEQVLVQLFREADVDGNNVLSLPEFKVTHSA